MDRTSGAKGVAFNRPIQSAALIAGPQVVVQQFPFVRCCNYDMVAPRIDEIFENVLNEWPAANLHQGLG
jgi:hypothetical protein